MDIKTAQELVAPQSGGEIEAMMVPKAAAVPPGEIVYRIKTPIPARVEALAERLGMEVESLETLLLTLVDDSMPDSMFESSMDEIGAAAQQDDGTEAEGEEEGDVADPKDD